MKIKMIDLHGQYLGIKDEIDEAIKSVLKSGQFINGTQVELFCKEFADYLDVNHIIPCANGTDALQIAMMALEFKPGDEIIMPAYNYISAAEVTVLLGLKPVFVDVDRRTFNIDVSQIENRITSKTVAILPVHLYGQCADMEPILKIADRYKLAVIEDNAQSVGAEYTFSDGKVMKAGTMGTIGTTSFYPTKNLGCYGDGGALFTNDSMLALKCRAITNHGQDFNEYYSRIGINSRLDELQAAILRVRLKHLDEEIHIKNDLAKCYYKNIKEDNRYLTPFTSSNSTHTYYKHAVKVENVDMLKIFDRFKNESIELELNKIPFLNKLSLFGGEDIDPDSSYSDNVINLPIHTLLTTKQIETISSLLIDIN